MKCPISWEALRGRLFPLLQAMSLEELALERLFLNEKVVGLPVFHGVLFLLCWAALRGSDRNIVALLDAMDPQ
jgi:hypothetical protein